MRIDEHIELIEPFPAIYLEQIDCIAIADLHLGYEGIMAEQGIYIPRVQFREEMEALRNICERCDAKHFVVNGDVKHEFSETSYHEFKEIRELFSFLKERFEKVYLVKGNHDTFMGYLCRKYGVELHEKLLIKQFLFFHGHKEVDMDEANWIIIAHEHPAIALYDELGIKERIPCLLYGKMGRKNLIVLPAFSTLMSGSEVNLMSKEEFLSPLLGRVDLDEFEVIGVDREAGCFRLGKLKHLRY